MVDVEAGRYIGDVMYYKYKAVMYLLLSDSTLCRSFMCEFHNVSVIVTIVLGHTVDSTFGN